MSGRIRSIKPEILEDLATASLPSDAWRLFVSMIVLADDYGNLRAEPEWLCAQVFWSQKPSRDIRELLARLSERLVTLYSVDGQRYASIRNWAKHQKVDHPGKPRVPGPELGIRETLASPRETLAPDQDQDQDHDRDQDRRSGGEPEGNHRDSSPPAPVATTTQRPLPGLGGVENAPESSTRTIDPSEDSSTPPRADKTKTGRPTRGTRLPDGWSPSPATVDALRSETGGADPLACLPRFRDYWSSVAGAKGVKLDWEATYRNWVRTAVQRGELGGPSSRPARTATGAPVVQHHATVPHRSATHESGRKLAEFYKRAKAEGWDDPTRDDEREVTGGH